jgi:hypothetical protein
MTTTSSGGGTYGVSGGEKIFPASLKLTEVI